MDSMSGFGALGRAGMAAKPATVGYLDHPSPGRPTVSETTYTAGCNFVKIFAAPGRRNS